MNRFEQNSQLARLRKRNITYNPLTDENTPTTVDTDTTKAPVNTVATVATETSHTPQGENPQTDVSTEAATNAAVSTPATNTPAATKTSHSRRARGRLTVSMPQDDLDRARAAYWVDGYPRGLSWAGWVCETLTARTSQIEAALPAGQALTPMPAGTLPLGPITAASR